MYFDGAGNLTVPRAVAIFWQLLFDTDIGRIATIADYPACASERLLRPVAADRDFICHRPLPTRSSLRTSLRAVIVGGSSREASVQVPR
ncbi:hypothetical protein R11007_02817 [Ralstonia holmesii]|nr:hypothetical protein R11007_02817 [Ralstonia sp. LMG 32967]